MTRADAAAFLVAAATNPNAVNATIEIASDLKKPGSAVIPSSVFEGIVCDKQ